MSDRSLKKKWEEGYQSLARALNEFIPEEARLLELGCNRGQLTTHLIGSGRKITALDTDQVALQILGGQNRAIKTLNADLTDVPLPDSSFDVVYSNFVLGWLDEGELKKAAKEACRLMEKDGVVILSDLLPEYDTPAQKIAVEQGLSENNMRPSKRWWHPREVVEVLEGAGFSKCTVKYHDWHIKYSPDEAVEQLRLWDAKPEFIEGARDHLDEHGMELPRSFIVLCRKPPKILITGGIHGDEVNGIEAARIIEGWDDPNIMVISPANPLAYEAGTKTTPTDGKDLNRSFPGRPDGTDTERLAHDLFERVKEAHMVVDLHTGSQRRYLYPHVRVRTHDPSALELAKDIGLEYILKEEGTPGMLPVEAGKIGVSAVVIEAGTAGVVDEGIVDLMANAVKNLIEGKPSQDPIMIKRERVRSPEDGDLKIDIKPGDKIKKGEVIGRINEKEISSPRDGFVLGIRLDRTIKEGGIIANIGYESR